MNAYVLRDELRGANVNRAILYLKAYPPEQGTEPALTPLPHLPMMLACARSG